MFAQREETSRLRHGESVYNEPEDTSILTLLSLKSETVRQTLQIISIQNPGRGYPAEQLD